MCGVAVEHQAAMARTKRSANRTANWSPVENSEVRRKAWVLADLKYSNLQGSGEIWQKACDLRARARSGFPRKSGYALNDTMRFADAAEEACTAQR